jgi:hypothetical protein
MHCLLCTILNIPLLKSLKDSVRCFGGHHQIYSAHVLFLGSCTRGLHVNEQDSHQLYSTASSTFLSQSFLQSSRTVPSHMQEQPKGQGCLCHVGEHSLSNVGDSTLPFRSRIPQRACHGLRSNGHSGDSITNTPFIYHCCSCWPVILPSPILSLP